MDELLLSMEYFDIVDEDGKPTGAVVSRETAHEEGIPHRTSHVWIVRKTEKGYDILMQKRSLNKDSFPGMYDTSSAGHIRAGDKPVASAIRELEEELGEDLFGQNNTFDVKPVPGTEDLYYTIPEKLPVKCGKKRYYRQPAIIFGVDETSGEVISPGAKQIYAAMRYFENASVTIKTHEGRETAVFCFD